MMSSLNWLLATGMLVAIGHFLFPSEGFTTRQTNNRRIVRDEQIFQRILPIQDGEGGFPTLRMGRRNSRITKQSVEGHWFPLELLDDDKGNIRGTVETESLQLCALLIQKRLNITAGLELDDSKIGMPFSSQSSTSADTIALAKGKFLDLTCSVEGEQILESMFKYEAALAADDTVVRGAIIALQSLLVLGTQNGVRGTPEQLQRYVSHLKESRDEMATPLDFERWDSSCVRRLKSRVDRTAGVQLLAELKWKRTPQGACDLLVEMGAWQKHEDLGLLRSGFSLRFSQEEYDAANYVSRLNVVGRLIVMNPLVKTLTAFPLCVVGVETEAGP